ncbi:MAG: hypothetical protein AAB370_09760 [Verrucomicrobiota bacterium]|mgnify:CR=1 FL=1
MFGFFKRKPKQLTIEEYEAEYRRLLRELSGQFAVGDSPQEQVLQAMSVIDHEMNGNGGCNWVEANYIEYLNALRDYLTKERRFTSDQLDKIRWSLDEILACGKELEQQGESARGATEAVDYLILRVVDWCHMNPRQSGDDSGDGR